MIACRVRQLAVTASTNDDARQSAEAGESEGLVIRALRQTSGRGRHGRTWESPEGNIYCSILLRPKAGPQAYGQISFVASLAIMDTVRPLLPRADIKLKWPNDVLVDGKKISGILLESGSDWLIAGMGLNVLHHPENALYPTTSLHAAGALALDDDRIFDDLINHFGARYEIFQEQGFGAIRAAWLENAKTGSLTVKLAHGPVNGDFMDIDNIGRLRLCLADGSERAIATGDVFFSSGD